jgi:hypothetical protein
MGLIEQPRKIIAGHCFYIWLSRRGITQLGLSHAYYTPRASTIKHIYAVNAIRLQFEQNNVPAYWHSARTIKLASKALVPDAELRQADGTIAIKVIDRLELLDITLHDEVEAISNLVDHYTKVWCFSNEEVSKDLKKDSFTRV